MFLRCVLLQNRTAVTTFSSYFSHWISYFDSPVFTVVDRGSNLASSEMKTYLNLIQSQLCTIPTEAPRSLGANERSHQYSHQATDLLINQQSYDPGDNVQILLFDVSNAWNLTLHANNILPHNRRFRKMARILRELDVSSRLS